MNSVRLHRFECRPKPPLHMFLRESDRKTALTLIQKPLWENYNFYENTWNQRISKGLWDDLANLTCFVLRRRRQRGKKVKAVARDLQLVTTGTTVKDSKSLSGHWLFILLFSETVKASSHVILHPLQSFFGMLCVLSAFSDEVIVLFFHSST